MLSKGEYLNLQIEAPVVERLRNYKSFQRPSLNYLIYYGHSRSTEVTY
jgi:hypothetical protein